MEPETVRMYKNACSVILTKENYRRVCELAENSPEIFAAILHGYHTARNEKGDEKAKELINSAIEKTLQALSKIDETIEELKRLHELKIKKLEEMKKLLIVSAVRA